MVTRGPLRSACLILALAFLAAPANVVAQDQVSPIQIPAEVIDTVGDSPYAPDIGIVHHSVQPHGANRTVVVGVWVNRNGLAQDEQVNLYFNTQDPGGDPTYRGEYLFFLAGNTYWIYAWRNGGWVQEPVANTSVRWYADGRIYFTLDFLAPQSPTVMGLRVTATKPADSANDWIDYRPEPGEKDLDVSLEPHGSLDPLENCSYNGCVGPASGPGNFGPSSNAGSGNNSGSGRSAPADPSSAACKRARKRWHAAKRKLSRARNAPQGSRASYTSKVRKLKKSTKRRKRAYRAKC